MPVNIHGNSYVTVAERVQALHEDLKDRKLEILTEFLPSNGMIVCKATVKIEDNIFQGTSAANPAKAIEKQSPYEVAETSAIGRALGFAGYGIVEGIASADEIVKAEKNGGYKAPVSVQNDSTPDPIMEATAAYKRLKAIDDTRTLCDVCHAPSGKPHAAGCPNAN